MYDFDRTGLRLVSSYLADAFDKRDQVVADAHRILADVDIDFDTIVVTGLSGSLVGPLLADGVG